PLASVVLVKNDRFNHPPGSIEELAREIKQDGQFHPLVVRVVKGKNELIAGERRYLAQKHNEAEQVPAIVVEADDEKAKQMRLAENAHRVDLSEAEYALAVARIYETTEGTRELRIALTAAKIAKPERWVRDRLYLAQTTELVRELVHNGRLPLEHARELRKVADPRLQEELAKEFAARASGGEDGKDPTLDISPRDLEDLREQVKLKMRSLFVVPWDKSVRVPGVNAPACVDCPYNTANDQMLFEYAPEPQEGERCLGRDDGAYSPKTSEGGPHCLNAGCFKAKTKASLKIITEKAKGAAKIVQREELPCSPKRLGEADLVPAGVNPQTFSTEVRRNIKGPGAAPAPSSRKLPASDDDARDEEAYNKMDDQADDFADKAEKKWSGETIAFMKAWLKKGALREFALFLLFRTAEWRNASHYDAGKRSKIAVSPKLATLIDKAVNAKTVADLQALYESGHGSDFSWHSARNFFGWNTAHVVVDHFLKKAGAAVGPQPDQDAIKEKKYKELTDAYEAKKAEKKVAPKDSKPSTKKGKGKKGGGK
ncbi:MAG TPA: ParB/RepB/Spo0J family partition protein, partial [Phycisphaerales bacterium]|nr:ParB/RepB/Spo0J family partition protein [Phycisphaerales bacterium]